MSERKEEAGKERPLVFLHQLAHDIVDRRDMVGVDRVPQSENVGEQGGAQERRPAGELGIGPNPNQHVESDQHGIDAGQFSGLSGGASRRKAALLISSRVVDRYAARAYCGLTPAAFTISAVIFTSAAIAAVISAGVLATRSMPNLVRYFSTKSGRFTIFVTSV